MNGRIMKHQLDYRILLSLTTLLALTCPPAARSDEPKGDPLPFKRLKFRSIGPAAGGRVCRVAGVPGDPLTCYAATAASGLWKSTDGGIHWKPIADDQPTSTFGSLAIAPSNPNVIYAGSGEANIRGNIEVGNGIYKSSDAGKTWKHVWKQEGQIGTMIVHPTNPDIAFAAVLGHAFGPNPERGVYRTMDGGKTWQRVLFKDADTGASDVCFDPSNPQILFAGLWQARRRPWELISGGPGSGLYVSRDGGDTWTQLLPPPSDEKASPSHAENGDEQEKAPKGKKYARGLPEGVWGKIGVAVAPSDGRRVYALIEADKGGLFRSDDGGDTWQLVNDWRVLRQRAFYYTTLTIDPRNPDVVWCPQVPLLKSIDGGKTFQRVKGPHHGDHHDVWIDPKDPRRLLDGNDGGVDISTNGGETWFAPPLPWGQFYHISADNRLPYHVAGTMQDIGTGSGPSNSLSKAGIAPSDWHPVGGGETGFTASDPTNPDIVYAGEYGGYISRYDHRTRQARNISVYPLNAAGHAASELKYRFQWTAPILISPHDHRVVYHAANVLFKTSDGGRHWTPISPDLTRNDKSKQKWSGGPITGDNTGVEVYDTIYALAESPKERGVLWVGSDDGLVHVSRNGGRTWNNVTANIKGLPAWGTVRCIEASPFDAGTAYVVVDAHKLDDRRPYLFQTKDFGQTWRKLAVGEPTASAAESAAQAAGSETHPTANATASPEGYLHVIREDPQRQGLLYLGGERGLFVSWDDGDTWTPLRLNLPTVTITDLVVKHNDLVIGTNGRSIWILDDLTPLRQWKPALKDREIFLFPPVPAVRYRYHEALGERKPLGAGANPPEGAILHYFLKNKPKGAITLEILDDKGRRVTLLTSQKEPEEKPEPGDFTAEGKYKKTVLPTAAGLHRLVWDLRYEGAESIKGAKVDSGRPNEGPLVNPGTYTLKLTVEDHTQTTTLQVLPDPRTISPGVWARTAAKLAGTGETPALLTSEAILRRIEWPAQAEELKEQLELTLKIRDAITSLTRTVEQIRGVKKQLLARNELLKDQARAQSLVKASRELLSRLDALEEKLHNSRAKIPYDILAQKGGAKLYSQLIWLFETMKASDGAPTQGVRELFEEQSELLRKYQQEWQALTAQELAALNEQAKKLDVPILLLPR
jgi:photosystem II stability/assembly factor-like uncharacterized protein